MKKILVANRGEIALRIMRSAKEMGIKTVAIYSEADRNAIHVLYADEAVCVGPAASSESYLRGDKIIEAALELGIDGIHPGFGFLSENSTFAKNVTDAGITFIGPSPHSIDIMGSKLKAKDAVSKYDIPMVPGTDKAVVDPKKAIAIAKGIGFPILIKASAGGGGKGMRVVDKEEVLKEQMEMAISEAESAFGDGSVFIEKYITSPRHIEIQVLGDKHGNIVHLFERECSIQRRHQKVVEEAPAVIMTEDLRAKMTKSAIDVAKSCDYVGAGTVEFLVDSDLNYYFLEMNTRLQVEHPVTEKITGVDLVKEQINVARGEKLAFTQDDLKINGHSIEVRVYAEDPKNNFLPDIGTLLTYELPKGEGIRVDDGFAEGMDIPIYYDPMIAKLTVHADTRNAAIRKMDRAITDYKISGIKTTLDFGKFVMNHPAFISGDFDTQFIKKHFDPENFEVNENNVSEELIANLAAHLYAKGENKAGSSNDTTTPIAKSNWRANRRSV